MLLNGAMHFATFLSLSAAIIVVVQGGSRDRVEQPTSGTKHGIVATLRRSKKNDRGRNIACENMQ